MRWLLPFGCVLSIVALTGCPHAFRRDGAMDRAAHQDVEDLLEECPQNVYEMYCASGREASAECLEKCGR
jgi:hypothetical protein